MIQLATSNHPINLPAETYIVGGPVDQRHRLANILCASSDAIKSFLHDIPYNIVLDLLGLDHMSDYREDAIIKRGIHEVLLADTVRQRLEEALVKHVGPHWAAISLQNHIETGDFVPSHDEPRVFFDAEPADLDYLSGFDRPIHVIVMPHIAWRPLKPLRATLLSSNNLADQMHQLRTELGEL